MTFKKTSVFSKQNGDTVVEVMIAIAVIAAILVGAFLVARSSSRNVRNSEEHSMAINMLQGQTELLRAAATDPANHGQLTSSSAFCLSTAGAISSASSTDCTLDSLYNISIRNLGGSDASTYTFQTNADWDRLGGGQNHVQILYRVHVEAP